jgi:peptidyl-prolyl cis-trans isomerase A (cyclophilin A)
MSTRVLASFAFVAFVLAGCTSPKTPPHTTITVSPANCAAMISAADGSNSAHTRVMVETTKGVFRIELFDDASPITAKNFKTYVEEKYYDHVVYHRIIKGFMMQGGKFDNTTKSAKTPTHDPIKNEAKSSGCLNQAYTLSMARTQDPDSAQTEFFVNFVDNTFLDPSASSDGYAVFGIVYEGREVVQAIANVKVHVTGANDKMCQPEGGGTPNCPDVPVEMKSVTVFTGQGASASSPTTTPATNSTSSTSSSSPTTSPYP